MYYTYSMAHVGLDYLPQGPRLMATILCMWDTLHILMVHICSIPSFPHSILLHPLSCSLTSLKGGLSSKPTSAQVLTSLLQSRTLDFTAESLSPGNLLPHFSLLQSWAAPASAHLSASPSWKKRVLWTHTAKPSCPAPPHQAWLTQSPL